MRTIAIITLTLALAACASQPLYAPAAGPNQPGYTETRLGDSRFRVGFTGRSNTTSDQVKNYAMLRAAELTTLHGYDWFKVVSRESEQTDKRDEPRVSVGVGVGNSCYPWGCPRLGSRWYTGVYVDDYYNRERHHTSIEILLGKGKPDNPESVYDADELLKYLRQSPDIED